MRSRQNSLLVVVLLVLAAVLPERVVGAEEFADPAFRRVWERTDLPVQQGRAAHSWLWGPTLSPAPTMPAPGEVYLSSPGASRQVQYFDKSRMEINDPSGDSNNPWYVTNGLLVNEMVLGSVAIADDRGIPLAAANIPIAGDPDNPFPTYASLIRLHNAPAGRRPGHHVTAVFLPEGGSDFPQYADSPATEIVRIERGFGIPRVFWDFMHRRGTVYQDGRFVSDQPLLDWVYVLGLPTTDAFWTRVRVAGVEREVMFQAFERRVLTYTPANPAAFQVEMGNVGRHYFTWRYVAPFAGGRRGLITVPARGAAPTVVTSPLLVQGFENGSAFEANVLLRLRRLADGAELASEPTAVMRPDVGIPGPFEVTLTFTPPATDTRARLELVVSSPRDGAQTILDSVEVVLRRPG